MAQILNQPDGTAQIGHYLNRQFADTRWNTFRAAVAFVRQSGVTHIYRALKDFLNRGNQAIISVGVDLNGSSYEGLDLLLQLFEGANEIWVLHNENGSTFHPKVYLFSNDDNAEVAVGSCNLTEGGLFTNYEVSLLLSLDFTSTDDRLFFNNINNLLDSWRDPSEGLCRQLDEALLRELSDHGYIIGESELRQTRASRSTNNERGASTPAIFPNISVPRPQRREGLDTENHVQRADDTDPTQLEVRGFLMTLQRTDVGVGQTSQGTSRRSPEIFIPLTARDQHPEFWGYPDAFQEDQANPGKMDRPHVRFRIGGTNILVNMMTWPAKHDFRLRSEGLRSAGNIGDILRIERTHDTTEFDYYAEIIPPAATDYTRYSSMCIHPVRNSSKLFGYY